MLTKRVALLSILAIVFVLSGSNIAMAHPLSYSWSGDYVGSCGVTEGGYVVAVQRNLKTHEINLGPSGTDGYFGTYTYNGVKTYQSQHGLQVDGCVGPQTWSSMSAHLQYLYSSTNRQYWWFIAADHANKYCEYTWDTCWWHEEGGLQVNHGWSINWCL